MLAHLPPSVRTLHLETRWETVNLTKIDWQYIAIYMARHHHENALQNVDIQADYRDPLPIEETFDVPFEDRQEELRLEILAWLEQQWTEMMENLPDEHRSLVTLHVRVQMHWKSSRMAFKLVGRDETIVQVE